MRDVILRLDAVLDAISADSVMLGQDIEKLRASSSVHFRMLENKLRVAARLVGKRSEDLASDLDSPTVWAALAVINQKVEEVRAGANKYINSTPAVDPLLASKVVKLEQVLLSTVTHLSQAIGAISRRVDTKFPPGDSMDMMEALGTGFYTNLQGRMGKMTNQIENSRAEKQILAI
jgi:hypothetical protein